jgi:outer membrane beta-barrel protein
LSAVHNTLPVIREIRSQYGGEIHWVPWYAKINVFNKVLYFDWYFAAGAGALQSALYNSTTDAGVTTATEVDQTNFAFFWGTGHIYHITDSLLVRLDFTSAVYNAQVFGTGGATSWYSNLNVGAGVGWRL